MTGIELLVGAAMPVIIEFFARWVKNEKGKFLLSLLLPLIAGTALNYQNLKVGDIEQILASGTVIFTAAQTVYKIYFRDSALQRKIAA